MQNVTPYVGVWIETRYGSQRNYFFTMSLLMWECGLKRSLRPDPSSVSLVTPYVGVWIETNLPERIDFLAGVTPYVGVWIETVSLRSPPPDRTCHSLCGSVD